MIQAFCLSAIAWLFTLSVAAQQTASELSQPLAYGQTITREIRRDEKQSYTVSLAANTYARIGIEQKGLQVRADVFDAANALLLHVNRPTDYLETKYFSLVAGQAATFRIEIKGSFGTTPIGNSYAIKIIEMRPAIEQDNLRLEAERLLMNIPFEPQTLKSKENYFSDLERAIALFHQTGDRWYESLAMRSYGQMYVLYNERARGIEVFKRALALAREIKDRGGEAAALYRIGIAYRFISEHQEALDNLQQSLAIARSLKDPYGIAATLNALGQVYFEMGAPAQALSYHQQAATVYGAESYRMDRNIGDAYGATGDYQQALTFYEKALSSSVLAPTASERDEIFERLGNVYAKLGDSQKALSFYDKALRLQRENGNAYRAAITLSAMGETYYAMRDTEQALSYFNQALPMRIEVEDAAGEALTRYWLARIESDRGRLAQALAEIERAVDLSEGVRAKIIGDELRASYLASVSQYYEFYIDLLYRLHKAEPSAGYDERSFLASERARARSLL